MTPTELLPCPFCGSTNIDPEGWASLERKGPACDDCSGTADTVELWNARPHAYRALPSDRWDLARLMALEATRHFVNQQALDVPEALVSRFEQMLSALAGTEPPTLVLSPPTPDQEAYLREIQENTGKYDPTVVIGGPGKTDQPTLTYAPRFVAATEEEAAEASDPEGRNTGGKSYR